GGFASRRSRIRSLPGHDSVASRRFDTRQRRQAGSDLQDNNTRPKARRIHIKTCKMAPRPFILGDGVNICEATRKGVCYSPLYPYIGHHRIRVRRDPALTMDERWRIAVSAL